LGTWIVYGRSCGRGSPCGSTGPTHDRLLDITDAPSRLGASKDWLYRNSGWLPFAVRLSERAPRYSAKGIDR